MIYKWETDKERVLKHMRIPAKKKLEWLRDMNEFIEKASIMSVKRRREIREKLRN